MHPGIEGIGGDRQLVAGRDLEQGRIVADPQQHACMRGRAGADRIDEVELGHAARTGATQAMPVAIARRIPTSAAIARTRVGSMDRANPGPRLAGSAT